MLEIYGHPFSSYTWKVLIALYANETPFELRVLDPAEADHAHNAFVKANGGPQGTFPLLVDGDNVIFESTSIIEYLELHHAGDEPLLPVGEDAAIGVRMLDRTFDNYVMAPMTAVVSEYLRPEPERDLTRCDQARAKLLKSYRWLEGWLDYYPVSGQITLVECAAAPSLHYADMVAPIGAEFPRLRQWLAHLKALPPMARCISEAEPWSAYFPVPAAERG